MLFIALSPPYTGGGSIATKMAGVVLASLGSGGGELSFISLTHFYGPFSLAAWGSGTGGAGLIGAGAYAFATTSFGLSSKSTIFASAFLPIILLVSFFIVLPQAPLERQKLKRAVSERDYRTIADGTDVEDEHHRVHEQEGLLGGPEIRSSPYIGKQQRWTASLSQNVRRSRSLFFP